MRPSPRPRDSLLPEPSQDAATAADDDDYADTYAAADYATADDAATDDATTDNDDNHTSATALASESRRDRARSWVPRR